MLFNFCIRHTILKCTPILRPVIVETFSYCISIQTKSFFVPKTMVKCKCNDVCGFKVIEGLQFAKITDGTDKELRRFVTKTGRGCVGRLSFPGSGQFSGCIHLKRQQLPEGIVRDMDVRERIHIEFTFFYRYCFVYLKLAIINYCFNYPFSKHLFRIRKK